MKLGKETGSLMNHIYGTHSTNPPEKGMGCTILHWTDRNSYTVIEVGEDKKSCIIQRDIVKPLFEGMTDSQSYLYIPDPEGMTIELVYKWKHWRHKIGNDKVNVIFGMRSEYYDYSF